MAHGGVDAELRLSREREAHDRLAEELNPDLLGVPLASELDDAVLAALGDMRGKRVLEVGCGSGDLTLLLLQRGAAVTAMDLSPGMVDVARRRIARLEPDAECEFFAAPFENSGLPPDSFDLLTGRFILHHLPLEEASPEMRRVLRTGGRAVFAENSGRNPILMFARRRIVGRFGVRRLGTEDERPMNRSDFEVLRRSFDQVVASYPVFEFLRIFDRQVLRFRVRWVSRVATALDKLCERIPGLRGFSFRVIVILS